VERLRIYRGADGADPSVETCVAAEHLLRRKTIVEQGGADIGLTSPSRTI
jgi:hypothetical protein